MLTIADPEIQEAVINALGWIGPAAKAFIPELEALSTHSSVALRLAAGSALVRINGDAGRHLSKMLSLLAVPDSTQRQAVLEQLGELRTLSLDAEPQVSACLADPVATVRAAAALALARMEAGKTNVVQSLAALLDDPVAEVRLHAAIALSGLYRADLSVLPKLAGAQQDRDERVAAVASAVLRKRDQV
jgi:HEAT repeat protein